VRGVQLVGELLPLVREVLLEDGLEAGEFLGREERLAIEVVTVLAEECNVLWREHGAHLSLSPVQQVRNTLRIAPAAGPAFVRADST
jgi:hypothetical protein